MKWGGIGLAIIAANAIIYTQFMGAAPSPEIGPAPVMLYWVLLLIGVVRPSPGLS